MAAKPDVFPSSVIAMIFNLKLGINAYKGPPAIPGTIQIVIDANCLSRTRSGVKEIFVGRMAHALFGDRLKRIKTCGNAGLESILYST